MSSREPVPGQLSRTGRAAPGRVPRDDQDRVDRTPGPTAATAVPLVRVLPRTLVIVHVGVRVLARTLTHILVQARMRTQARTAVPARVRALARTGGGAAQEEIHHRLHLELTDGPLDPRGLPQGSEGLRQPRCGRGS
jgi:hypothetical protein